MLLPAPDAFFGVQRLRDPELKHFGVTWRRGGELFHLTSEVLIFDSEKHPALSEHCPSSISQPRQNATTDHDLSAMFCAIMR